MAENLNETKQPASPIELISGADFNKITKLVGKAGKITEKQAADALKASNGDATAAAKSLRQDLYKARFAKFANNYDGENTNWRKNTDFLTEAYRAINDELPNLPDALILEQVVKADADDTVYAEFLNKTAGGLDFINAGSGRTYLKEFFIQVVKMNEKQLIPAGRRDVDNYSKTSKVELTDDIKQVYLSVSPWLYVKYFLSGKVDEYCLIAISNMVKSMVMKQYFDWIDELKTMFKKIYAKTASTEAAKTNHIEGTKTGYLDCLQEYMGMIDRMEYHNNQFLYDDTTGVPYTSANRKNLIHIVSLDTMNTARKYLSTFLSKEGINDYFANWIVVPEQAYNTWAEDGETPVGLASSNIFEDSEGKTVKGAILTLDKNEVHRVANLSIANTAEFPFALTTFHNVFLRYNQKVMEWCSCSVFHNEALLSDFTVPTKTITTK